MTRARQLARRLGAILSLAGILTGLPVLLSVTVGSPTIHGLPGLSWVRDGLAYRYFAPDPLLRLLILIAWALWAYAVLATVLRTLTAIALGLRVAGGRSMLALSNRVALRPARTLIDAAIGVTLLATTVTSQPRSTEPVRPAPVVMTVQPQPLGHLAHDRDEVSVRLPAMDSQDDATAPPPAAGAALTASATSPDPDAACDEDVHVVRPGESYWSIAGDRLGDPYRWPEIFELNRGRQMPDGAIVEHAGLIRPNWPLRLPPARGTPDTPSPTPPPSAPTPDSGAQPSPAPPADAPDVTRSPDADAPADDSSIQLPSGSVIAASFASGMLTAFALARLRARRRYQPGLPAPGLSHKDPDLPDTMRQLLQRLQPTAPASQRPDEDEATTSHHGESRPAHQETFAPGSSTMSTGQPAPPSHQPNPVHPSQPAEATGTVVAIGTRDGSPVLLDLAEHPSLSISGPGASGLVRAIATGLLAGNGPHDIQLITLGPPPWSGVPDFPGLQHAADPDTAFRDLDTELLRRARLLDAADVSDLDAYRDDSHGEPVPNIILVVGPETADQQSQRLHALLDHGHRLGVTALLADARLPEPGAVLQIGAEGQPTAATPVTLLDDLDRIRLHHLTDTEAADLLTVLARARRDDDQQGTAPQAQAADPAELFGKNIPPPDTSETANPPPQARPQPADDGAPIQVQLLGTYRVTIRGNPVGKGVRGKALELLAYYLLHPEGAPLDSAIEALWPGVDPVRGRQRLWTALGNLRTTVRAALNRPEPEIDLLVREGQHYRFEPDLIDCDLWHFNAALTDADNARTTNDTPAEITALQTAADTYHGDLIPDLDYVWTEAPREALHRRALDTLTRLADLHQRANATIAAVTSLERAIQLSPETEELYRRLMRLQAPNRDAINRTYQRLKTALADRVAADPSPETEQLRTELLRRGKG